MQVQDPMRREGHFTARIWGRRRDEWGDCLSDLLDGESEPEKDCEGMESALKQLHDWRRELEHAYNSPFSWDVDEDGKHVYCDSEETVWDEDKGDCLPICEVTMSVTDANGTPLPLTEESYRRHEVERAWKVLDTKAFQDNAPGTASMGYRDAVEALERLDRVDQWEDFREVERDYRRLLERILSSALSDNPVGDFEPRPVYRLDWSDDLGDMTLRFESYRDAKAEFEGRKHYMWQKSSYRYHGLTSGEDWSGKITDERTGEVLLEESRRGDRA